MKIKVCGMKHPSNIREISDLGPDYMGFIFYSKSKRDVTGILDEPLLNTLGKPEKVGVFVNEAFEMIKSLAEQYKLSYIQLHGDESPELCLQLKKSGLGVIKVFSIDGTFDFSITKSYKSCCDFFLFDTKGENYGGTGKRFDWNILKEYDNEVPFFLSGGIEPDQADEIRNLKGLNIHAVDINSRFEIEPGLKDAGKVRIFMDRLLSE